MRTSALCLGESDLIDQQLKRIGAIAHRKSSAAIVGSDLTMNDGRIRAAAPGITEHLAGTVTDIFRLKMVGAIGKIDSDGVRGRGFFVGKAAGRSDPTRQDTGRWFAPNHISVHLQWRY